MLNISEINLLWHVHRKMFGHFKNKQLQRTEVLSDTFQYQNKEHKCFVCLPPLPVTVN